MGLKVVIACGGTGGHLFPGIAVAEALMARGHEPLLLISEKEIDTLAAKDHPFLRFERVPAIGMPRLLSPKIIPFAWKSWKTLGATKKILRAYGPDAVLGMGGFTSLPPAIAGRRLGARTFIHESNAIPGKANRLTARFCDAVLLGLADCAAYFPDRHCEIVGTPLRATMREPVDRTAAFNFFGLDSSKLTLLVMGGSQGARGVNTGVINAFASLDPAAVQVIHLTGRDDESAVREAVGRWGGRAFVAPFSPRLDLAYAVADVCVARSGASSLAELAHFGVATILIPYPFAAEDHQTRNAEVFSRPGAAILLKESDLPGGNLGRLLNELFTDGVRRTALAQKMHSLGVSDAAEKVCAVIEAAVAQP